MSAIKFYKPALYRKDMSAVLQTMVDENIGPGERKNEFLGNFSKLVGKSGGVALRTYADAIAASLRGLGLSDGDSVLISVLSPTLYVDVMNGMGIEPIFVDTDEYGLLSAEKAAKLISKGPKALILYEPACQVPQSFDEYAELGLPVIEDVSESLGSYHGDKSYGEESSGYDESYTAGDGGTIVISRFEEDGIISTGGGAAAVSGNDGVIERMKNSYGSVYMALGDMNASLGIVQISNIDTILKRRNELYRVFSKAQSKGSSELFGSSSPLFTPNGYSFTVAVNGKPEEIIDFAKKYSVPVRKAFTGTIGYRYRDRYDLYPDAVRYISRSVSFPIYPFLSTSEVESIERVISHLF